MRLWHQFLIPCLDRQRLLGQHRECCALRGKGWNKKHATVNYVFKHNPARLIAYHYLIMLEMIKRGYKPDIQWFNQNWRGKQIGEDKNFTSIDALQIMKNSKALQHCIFEEHNDNYLRECENNIYNKKLKNI